MNAEERDPFALLRDLTVVCAVVTRPLTCGTSGTSAAATVVAEALAGIEATAVCAVLTVLARIARELVDLRLRGLPVRGIGEGEQP